jgi:hypothetical protein
MTVGDTALGWRICYTRPAQKQLMLYSPVFDSRKPAVTCRTTDRIFRAACSLHDHDPPAPGCRCGVYAVANVVDGLYRLRAMSRNIVADDWYNCWFPLWPDRGMAPILAQVTLHRAVDHDDKGTWSILSKVKQQIGASTPVIRAASAEIERVFVTAGLIGREAAVELANRLAASLGVEAVAGFPEYSTDDWDTRPDWMRSEPWRSRYFVDAMLPGFTRDGYRPEQANERHTMTC